MNIKYILFFAIITSGISNSQQRNSGFFHEVDFNEKYINAWIDGGPENLFQRTPTHISNKESYQDKVKNVTQISIKGSYFSIPQIIQEIEAQAKENQYSALFGWAEALSVGQQCDELSLALVVMLSANNTDNFNFALCYTIDTLTSYLEDGKEYIADRKLVQQIAVKLASIKVVVSGRKFIKGDYCSYLKKRVEKSIQKIEHLEE